MSLNLSEFSSRRVNLRVFSFQLVLSSFWNLVHRDVAWCTEVYRGASTCTYVSVLYYKLALLPGFRPGRVDYKTYTHKICFHQGYNNIETMIALFLRSAFKIASMKLNYEYFINNLIDYRRFCVEHYVNKVL